MQKKILYSPSQSWPCFSPERVPLFEHWGCREQPLSDCSCKCPSWPSLFCFPCCHNISAAKSRNNWLQRCPHAEDSPWCLQPPGPTCNPTCVLSACGLLGNILGQGKTFTQTSNQGLPLSRNDSLFSDVNCWKRILSSPAEPIWYPPSHNGALGNVTHFSRLRGGGGESVDMRRIRSLFSFVLDNTGAVAVFRDCDRNECSSRKMILESTKLGSFPGHLTRPYVSPKWT